MYTTSNCIQEYKSGCTDHGSDPYCSAVWIRRERWIITERFILTDIRTYCSWKNTCIHWWMWSIRIHSGICILIRRFRRLHSMTVSYRIICRMTYGLRIRPSATVSSPERLIQLNRSSIFIKCCIVCPAPTALSGKVNFSYIHKETGMLSKNVWSSGMISPK